MTVQVGSEIGVLSNITPTSADVSLGAHPAAIEDVSVTLSNGQSDTLVGGIQFFVLMPTLTAVTPNMVPENTPTAVTITGTNFEASMTVQIGAEVGAVSSVTSTSADVSISGHTADVEDVTVTITNGQSDTLAGSMTFTGQRIFFVTSSSHSGDFGGIAAADAICNARASEGGLPGNYQAWISDGVTSPAARSTQGGFPYVDTLGVTLAADWAAFMSPSMGNIRRDENGIDVGSSSRAWTNVDHMTLGSASSNHCTGWTSTSGSGGQGITGVTGSNWTNASSPIACTSSLHLYCIQQ